MSRLRVKTPQEIAEDVAALSHIADASMNIPPGQGTQNHATVSINPLTFINTLFYEQIHKKMDLRQTMINKTTQNTFPNNFTNFIIWLLPCIQPWLATQMRLVLQKRYSLYMTCTITSSKMKLLLSLLPKRYYAIAGFLLPFYTPQSICG